MPTMTLPLARMTVDEKLRIMEDLWEDLSRDEEQVEVPQWHKDVLAERERLVRSGKARFIDWNEARKRIARRLA